VKIFICLTENSEGKFNQVTSSPNQNQLILEEIFLRYGFVYLLNFLSLRFVELCQQYVAHNYVSLLKIESSFKNVCGVYFLF
jgi:hypothetical protein